MKVTDPRHPLYGQSLPVLRFADRQAEKKRVCIVWLEPFGERVLDIEETDLSTESISIFPLSVSLFSMEQLVSVFQNITSLLSENTENEHSGCQSVSGRSQNTNKFLKLDPAGTGVGDAQHPATAGISLHSDANLLCNKPGSGKYGPSQ